jgi:hypothetical protein
VVTGGPTSDVIRADGADLYLERRGDGRPLSMIAGGGGGTSWHSPFTPLQTSGTSSDNIYYTGTPGLPYNKGSGLGYPDLSALAYNFGYFGGHGH